ncbi:unnamed protein product, partial [Urochloa humidicola]
GEVFLLFARNTATASSARIQRVSARARATADGEHARRGAGALAGGIGEQEGAVAARDDAPRSPGGRGGAPGAGRTAPRQRPTPARRGVDFIKLPCQHYFCRRCMETYSRMHVKEGTVLKLLCPDDKCRSDVPPNLLKQLLGDADFERWERLILQKTLDSMSDAAYCPRCETICLEDDEKNAQCSKCFFSFCTLCKLRRHIGERCVGITPEEKLLSLQERQKVRRLSKGDLEKTISLAKEIVSIKEVLRLCVQCPYCDIGISRVSGCNHMVCGNCGRSFCYGCGEAGCPGCNSTKARNDPGKVEKLDVTRFLTAQTDASTETRKEPTIVRSRQYPCPNCHHPNSKVGNNHHIFCQACQVHYCASCRKVVRKYAEHYGPRGCKQHSVDP